MTSFKSFTLLMFLKVLIVPLKNSNGCGFKGADDGTLCVEQRNCSVKLQFNFTSLTPLEQSVLGKGFVCNYANKPALKIEIGNNFLEVWFESSKGDKFLTCKLNADGFPRNHSLLSCETLDHSTWVTAIPALETNLGPNQPDPMGQILLQPQKLTVLVPNFKKVTFALRGPSLPKHFIQWKNLNLPSSEYASCPMSRIDSERGGPCLLDVFTNNLSCTDPVALASLTL